MLHNFGMKQAISKPACDHVNMQTGW